MSKIGGSVAPGYELVRETFKNTFPPNVGAACTVYVDGKKVVDLWGGYQNKKQQKEWNENTLVPVYSVTKSMTNLAVAKLVDQGRLNYGDPVAKYWPEFGQNGKEQVTVSQLLTHQAGLSHFDEGQIPLSSIPDVNETGPKREEFANFLAKQKPKWNPKDKKTGYHAHTVGFFAAELIRRADAKNRTISKYFSEEIASKVNAEFYIGVDPSLVDIGRLAQIVPPSTLPEADKISTLTKKAIDPTSLSYRSFNPISKLRIWDAKSKEIPSSMGFATSDGVAKLFSMISCKGNYSPHHNIFEVNPSSSFESMSMPYFDGECQILHQNVSYSQSGLRTEKIIDESGSNKLLWHSGYGGSLGYADVDKKIGFSFITNTHLLDDSSRDSSLLRAVYQCTRQSKL
eukprot:TRINITY_DN6979_c0_g1_i1.p1 TRINITY_DN6979_c0_g1~~TRINITY_DN6979_c0_g1_i1.p1  ORF type:complete len:406 (-),score=99.52 TRINITY_DN6979_c0_g1_i1:107-1303(-)